MADKKNKDEKELMDIFGDKRSFIQDGEKYYIDNADIDTVRGADWHYAKTFNEAISYGIATMAQMQDVLEDRKVIGKSYEAKRQELLADLDEKIAELNSAKDLKTKKQLAEDVEEARNKLFRHNQKASSPLGQTAEQLSDDARVEYLTANMIKDSEGNRVWESYEDYKTTQKMALAMRSRYEVMLYLQGLQSDFLEQTPEAIARREIEDAEKTELLEDDNAKVNSKEKSVIKNKSKDK